VGTSNAPVAPRRDPARDLDEGIEIKRYYPGWWSISLFKPVVRFEGRCTPGRVKSGVLKMWGKIGVVICCLFMWTLLAEKADTSHADDDDRGRHRERTRERDRKRDHSPMKPVSNPLYKEECGACHFTYQPELLPSGSWRKLVSELDNHFGESVALDDDSKKAILDYLTANSAEKSSAKRAVRIMRSLGSDVPSRITDIPYIRKKHRKIPASVLEGKSIGSLSNCSACHTTAEEGVYDDDYVIIPK